MYRIYADGQILHNPRLAESGRVVVAPVVVEKLNTHGTLEFYIAPTNPLYDALKKRKTQIKVVPDSSGSEPWFGRVMSIERGWNNLKKVYCEGILGHLCDSIFRPFGFKGAPDVLFANLITAYNGSVTGGPEFYPGNVSVTDPNNLIVRSSSYGMNVWEAMDEKLFGSSLGGYILPRYDAAADRHYIDYLSLDGSDPYARTSSQKVEFGRNLLDFTEYATAEEVVTVLIPYGAQIEQGESGYEESPPENGFWNGNRITVRSVNRKRDYIENAGGVALWGRIVGTKVWDDVTLPQNLLDKSTVWLARQIWESLSLELTAVDLSNVDADIEQIRVGDYVRCYSRPHDLDLLLLCTAKTTKLTELEESSIVLGAGQKTVTDLQRRLKNGNLS